MRALTMCWRSATARRELRNRWVILILCPRLSSPFFCQSGNRPWPTRKKLSRLTAKLIPPVMQFLEAGKYIAVIANGKLQVYK